VKRHAAILSLLLAAGVMPATLSLGAANEESAPRDFKGIPARNVFGLKAPTPPAPPAPPPSPTINVKLTGLLTILSSKRAVLQITEGGKTESKIIKEGDRDGEVEVLEINEIAGTVRIKNRGDEATLDFDKNGVKPPTGPVVSATPTNIVMINGRPVAMPVPPGSPGAAPNPVAGMPVPTYTPPTPPPGFGTVPSTAPATLQPPTRIMRTP
jgi:hypothetical protein